MSSSQASSPHDSFSRFPGREQAGAIVLRRAATWSSPIPIEAAERRIVSFVFLGATYNPRLLEITLADRNDYHRANKDRPKTQVTYHLQRRCCCRSRPGAARS
jgi:hypothetical protein